MGIGSGNDIGGLGIVGYIAVALTYAAHSDRTVSVKGYTFVPETVCLNFDVCAAEGMANVGDLRNGETGIIMKLFRCGYCHPRQFFRIGSLIVDTVGDHFPIDIGIEPIV